MYGKRRKYRDYIHLEVKIMKAKIFPYFVRIASCLMSLILIVSYAILLDTINLTNVGVWVVLLWIIQIGLYGLFVVLVYRFIVWLKDKKKCES